MEAINIRLFVITVGRRKNRQALQAALRASGRNAQAAIGFPAACASPER
jgi:hypothetical protein